MTGKGGHVAFEIQWSARAAPIDPSPQAVPDSQFVMSSVLIKLNQPSNPKLIIGSPSGLPMMSLDIEGL